MFFPSTCPIKLNSNTSICIPIPKDYDPGAYCTPIPNNSILLESAYISINIPVPKMSAIVPIALHKLEHRSEPAWKKYCRDPRFAGEEGKQEALDDRYINPPQ